MLRAFTVIWVVGLFTAVPYSVYYLLWHAEQDQYAFLIVFPFFWVFGYWGIIGPLLSAWRIHRLMRIIEKAGSRSEVIAAIERHDGEELVVELIASENRIPHWLARRIYRKLVTHWPQQRDQDEQGSGRGGG